MNRLSTTTPGWALLVLSLVAMTHTAHASTLVAQTTGEAFDLRSNAPLYRETHCVSGDALTRQVIYKNLEDQLIAHKVLSYETGAETPSFVQHDVRSRDSVSVKLEPGQDEIVITAMDASRPDQARVVSVKPSASLPIVIDAGFDAFVRENWDSLVAGESKQFQFPVAARESLVALKIASASCSYDTDTDQCFTLQLNNWLFNLLADPIELGYDAKLQRLARFRGISNVSDGKGGAHVVDIHYRYHDVEAMDCAVNEREVKVDAAASSTPLLELSRVSSPFQL